jgi:UDP-N-acetylmuramyl pentapeptide phosphotransferase/UDP-N-acetylglucosamine-1-phosphate transferase
MASPKAKSLERTNFRGSTVSLAGGPALAIAASLTAAASTVGQDTPRRHRAHSSAARADTAGARHTGRGTAPGKGKEAVGKAPGGGTAAAYLVAGLGSGAVGFYDDVVGSRPEEKAYKGFKGHLGALKEGKVTAGLVKIAGVGLSALAASAMLPSPNRATESRKGTESRNRATESRYRGIKRAAEVALGAGVIAGTANLLNLLDLRPGRALKVGLLASGALGQAGPSGAAGALLPQDLGEEIMLGDTGANAFGAVLGVSLAARTGIVARAAVLTGLTALTLASEKVSFTKVIEKTPGLREIDAWGRR